MKKKFEANPLDPFTAADMPGGANSTIQTPKPLAWAKYPAVAGFYLNLIDGEARLKLVTQVDVDSQFFARCGQWFGPLPVPLP